MRSPSSSGAKQIVQQKAGSSSSSPSFDVGMGDNNDGNPSDLDSIATA